MNLPPLRIWADKKSRYFRLFLTLLIVITVPLTVFLVIGKRGDIRTRAENYFADLSLVPATQTVFSGEEFTVGIFLDTQGKKTDAIDVILNYDSSKLEVVSLTEGDLYPTYPLAVTEVPGVVRVSGVAYDSQTQQPTEPFVGSGILATVVFKAKEVSEAGPTEVTFDFNPNDKTRTTDTNVVDENSAEILNNVYGLTVTINPTECEPGETRSCATEDHFQGTQTCGENHQWAPCVAGEECVEGHNKCRDETCQLACGDDCVSDDDNVCPAPNGCEGTRTCTDRVWSECTTTLQPCDTDCDEVNDTCAETCETYYHCDADCDGTPETCQTDPCSLCDCTEDETRGCVTEDHVNGTQQCGSGFWGECAAGEPPTCTEGYTRCTDGQCRTDCGVNCEPGSQGEEACEYSGHFNGHQTCGDDGTAWSECIKDDPPTCFGDYTMCADGTCAVDCGECSPGAAEDCATEDHFQGTQTCGENRQWGECAAGEECAGGYQKCIDGTCRLECPPSGRGDINGDGLVNLQDLSILLSNWGSSPSDPGADVDNDGTVGIVDLSILLSNWTR